MYHANLLLQILFPNNNRIYTNTGFMLIEERDPETNENVDSPSSQNDFGDLMAKITKQRRIVERLKDPIVVKTQNRKQKTNLNAFKSKFLTCNSCCKLSPKKSGSRFSNNVSDSSDEEEVEPFTKENQLRKGDEHQDICGMETSIDDDEMGLEEM